MSNQSAELSWRDGTIPVSTRFDDPYFSLENGLSETRHVFLDGNDLPARFEPGFHIAELGFGSGLNLLAAWQAWEEAGQTTRLRFTSFGLAMTEFPPSLRGAKRRSNLPAEACSLGGVSGKEAKKSSGAFSYSEKACSVRRGEEGQKGLAQEDYPECEINTPRMTSYTGRLAGQITAREIN